MRKTSAMASLLAALVTAAPASAFEYEPLLKQVFGTADPAELGGPIFALIVVTAILLFWTAQKIGKRRQRRMIESYDDQLKDYASRLRRGKL